MQFETRIVNGKPSIFYKDDSSKGSQYSSRRAPGGKNTGRKSIRGSVAISGELDYVQPSPRQPEPHTASPERMTQAQINALNKKLGVKLNKKQLVSIMNTIQDSDRPKTNYTNRTSRFENNENLNNNNNYDDEIRRQKYSAQYEDDIKIYKPAQVVVVQEDDEQVSSNQNNKNIVNDDSTGRASLVDKKKLKWQQDKDSMDKMLQQERYDISKGVNSPLENPQGGGMSFYNGGSLSNRSNLMPKFENTSDSTSLKHKSTMTLAEKKRIQWQQERENTDAIKHKSTHDLTKGQQETASYRNQDDNLVKSNSLNSLLDNLEQSNRQIDSQQNQQAPRLSLMEKKRLKWGQDFEENYNPFGKPGCGAGPPKTNNLETETPSVVSHLPPTKEKNSNIPNNKNPKGQKYKESLEEYKKINDTLAQIIAAENKIKQDQIEVLRSQVNQQQRQEAQPKVFQPQTPADNNNNQSLMSNEQKMVPAAMRTSIMFGNVAHDDEIKRTKELERKKWLLELEAQKKEKMIDQQKQKVEADNYEQKKQNELRQSWNSPRADLNQSNNNNQFMNDDKSNVPAAMRTSFNFGGNQGGNQQTQNITQDNDQIFGRTRNLLDPAQLDELERKRNKNLQHKLEIEAQIAEKKRIKDLENQVQNLNNLKIENEAKQLNSQNQAYQEQKAKKPQYHNFEKILTTNADDDNNQAKKNVTMASILQGDTKKVDNEVQSTRNPNDAKTTDSHIRLQMAELAAAEEKHKRLLKRLQKGGHDTRNLENKFNEYKSKILSTTNPELNVNNNVANNINNNNVNNLDLNNRNFTSMSNHVVAELEQQKKTLEKGLRISNENINDNDQNNKISDQKMQQIFKLLKEDTMGIPAELTEDQLKAILNKVAQKQPADQQKPPQKPVKGVVNRTKSNSADNRNGKKVVATGSVKKGANGKPMWNATKTTKVKLSNSEKDPHYAERKLIAEERKQKRLEQHQIMVEKNNKKYQEFMEKKDEETQKKNEANRPSHQQQSEFTDRLSNQRQSISSNSTLSNYHPNSNYEDSKKGTKPQTESIMNLLTKNLANKNSIIYEDDEDRYLKPAPNSHRQLQHIKEPPKQTYNEQPQSQRFLSNENDLRLEDIGGSPLGFVPFMRTDEFLNPAHAASPIPPSREASAVKNEREKARNAYYKNQNPADYGSNYYNNGLDLIQESNRNRNKDPLLNNGLVKNNPTPRQEQILSQLATLKQSLMQKQRDVANSIQIDNSNGYNSDN